MKETPLRRVRVEISPVTILAVVLTGLGLWMIGQLVDIIVTVVFAFIWVGTLSPSVRWLEEHRVSRGWAVALVVLGGLAIVATVGLLVFPALWQEAVQVATGAPEIQSNLAAALKAHRLTVPLAGTVKNFSTGKIASGIDLAATATYSLKALEIIGYAATSVVLAIYFMIEPEKTRGALYAVIPRTFHVRVARILLNLEPIVGGYMRGQLLTSLFIGVFATVLLYACKVPNALGLAAIASLTDVIPFVGGVLATTPAFLSALPRGPVVAVTVLVAMLAYQEFESRVIVPRVYGKALRLSPAVVVLALLVGGKLGGIVGALLSLPLAAAARMIAEEMRFELPGDNTDDAEIKRRDEAAERAYARQTAGATPAEAGVIASDIAEKVLQKEGEAGKA